ncbi:MAG: carotenoid biosynthesis protein [Calditrichia bacterium]
MSTASSGNNVTARERIAALPYLKAGLLYLVLAAGGVWHVLGMFQTIMRITAAPVIIGLGIWLFAEHLRRLSVQEFIGQPGTTAASSGIFIQWGLITILGSIFLEWLGVKTGVIFGEYAYGETLPPFIDSVPLAIGFAWLGMLLASAAISQRLLGDWFFEQAIFSSLIIAGFMTVFDVFMEPAAVALNYWSWSGETVPVQNYIAWFLISFFFAWLAIRLKVFRVKIPALAFHAYLAQLLYFVLIYFK